MNSEGKVQRANWLRVELMASLQALAMPAVVQIELFPKGVCLACELTEDFENFSRAFSAACEKSTRAKSKDALAEIRKCIEDLSQEGDFVCWDERRIRESAGWEKLRELSKAALVSLGWPIEAPQKR
jgi:hypothetical protein